MFPKCIEEIQATTDWVVYWKGDLPDDCERNVIIRYEPGVDSSAIEARKWARKNYREGNILMAFRRDKNDLPEYVCKRRDAPRQNAFAAAIK